MKRIIVILVLLTMSLVQVNAGVSFAKGPLRPFAVRGFHLDLRIQALPMPQLKKFVLQLSKNGINTLVMEWEGTYPFKDEPLIPNRYAYTREEIKSFIDYCTQLKIDVIPLQQSFGHVEYILRNPKYKNLREDQKDYSQVNPLKEEGCRKLFTTLYRDLISTHKSDYIHIGGDETYLLGHSEESKKKVKAVGMGRLYGDYIKMLCEIVVSLGKKPVLWADIALKYPDAIVGLPKETVFVDWNYGWDVDNFGDHKKLMESGFEIWGAPALRSHPDNFFLTQWEKHFKNIRDFIPTAEKFGYKGIILTSWSTSGLYSRVLESTVDVVDLYAIRRVYPVSGFNMLAAAFEEALKTKPLDIKAFVSTYSKSQYGLDEKSSGLFWKSITAVPFEITQGKPVNTTLTINEIRDSTTWALNTLQALRPTKNTEEFEHYRLMAEIRLQYLSYQSIEARANAPEMTEEGLAALVKELEALDTGRIDEKFAALNKNHLYPAEIQEENLLRNAKIKILLARLQKAR